MTDNVAWIGWRLFGIWRMRSGAEWEIGGFGRLCGLA